MADGSGGVANTSSSVRDRTDNRDCGLVIISSIRSRSRSCRICRCFCWSDIGSTSGNISSILQCGSMCGAT